MQRFLHASIHPALIYTRGSFYPATKRRTGTRTTEISLDGVELIRETFSRERERNQAPHTPNAHVIGLTVYMSWGECCSNRNREVNAPCLTQYKSKKRAG